MFEVEDIPFFLIILVFFSVCCYMWGNNNGVLSVQKEAQRRAYGDFVVDKDLEIVFKWKEKDE